MRPAEALILALTRWYRIGQSTGALLIRGGLTTPRPKPCTMCGGRYRARRIRRGGLLLGVCPGTHATHRGRK